MARKEDRRELMGTQVSVILVGEGDLESAFVEAERIENEYSRFIEGNALARLNASVSDWTEVGPELFRLIEFGESMRRASSGAFDLSVKSILEGWGYDSSYSLEEGEAGERGEIVTKCGYVKLDAPIDLGGLGKGYAVDRMTQMCEDADAILVNAGGDIFARGKDEEGRPWKVAMEHPLDAEQAIGLVEVDGFALASSSANRRAWGDKHHLVDPTSGTPAGGMLAVYVQAKSAMLADAWSTALYVMGFEKARETVKELPVEALLISVDGGVWRSEGFEAELF